MGSQSLIEERGEENFTNIYLKCTLHEMQYDTSTK